MQIIETQISNPGFSVEIFANEMCLSTVQLYRKIKALTSYPPNELIRNIRLERAAFLLKQKVGNVAEVAYQVGFSGLSYFSKVFKEKYGVPPSELK
jgi:AraC-like DNA-binding protein